MALFFFYLLWGTLQNFICREFTPFPLCERYQALLCLAQWQPVALLHLPWAEPDLLYQVLLESFLGGWQRMGVPVAVDAVTIKWASASEGPVDGVIKMGERSTSHWKPRALNFCPWTGIEHCCLLPSMSSHAGEKDGPFEDVKWKPWRSTLRDREEMDKDLLKLKYLENGSKVVEIV